MLRCKSTSIFHQKICRNQSVGLRMKKIRGGNKTVETINDVVYTAVKGKFCNCVRWARTRVVQQEWMENASTRTHKNVISSGYEDPTRMVTHQYSDHNPVMREWARETAVFFHFHAWDGVVRALWGIRESNSLFTNVKNKNPPSTHTGPDAMSSVAILQMSVLLVFQGKIERRRLPSD